MVSKDEGPVLQRMLRIDGVIAALAKVREKGVNEGESRSLADIERQALVMLGVLQDIEARRLEMNGVEAQLRLHEVDEFCRIVEEGLPEAVAS